MNQAWQLCHLRQRRTEAFVAPARNWSYACGPGSRQKSFVFVNLCVVTGGGRKETFDGRSAAGFLCATRWDRAQSPRL